MTPFVDKLRAETVAQLEAARAYLVSSEHAVDAADPFIGLRINSEMFRITTRLARVLAWILAQKALQAGEITPAESIGQLYRLDDDPLCLARSDEQSAMPERVRDMLVRSRNLYERAARLDAQVRRRMVPAL